MPTLQELVRRVGGGKANLSDELADQEYAEKLIVASDTIKMLANLKVEDKVGSKNQYVTSNISELRSLGYEAGSEGLASGAQRINAVFVALRVPYRAGLYTSENAVVVEKVNKQGEVKPRKEPDILKMLRYGDTFEVQKYACTEAGKIGKDGKPQEYEEPTVGARKRTIRWIKEIGSKEVPAELERMGVDLERIEKDLETALCVCDEDNGSEAEET